MKRSASVLFVSVLLFDAAARAQPADGPPRKAEDAFRVHVTIDAVDDVAEDLAALAKGSEELRKRLRDNDDWFRVVERPEEADIVVSLRAYSNRAERRVLSIWGVVAPTEAGQPDRTQVVEIHTFHSLRARVELLGVRKTLTGTKSTRKAGGPEDAARDLAERLEALCTDDYPRLAARRRALRRR